ncbi:MAG: site-2 protease family protein, partial [Acidobacteriota bacterium]
MMQTIYRLPFRLLGIPIQLDLTFLLVLPLLAWLIGSEIDRLSEAFGLRAVEGRTGGVVASYLIGFLCALGLFLSVLIHELGHSFVGQKFHLKIRSITLWILGGMAQFESIPRRKGTEAVMAMAGPVTSLLVGLVSWILLRATPDGLPALQFVFAYLMFMNWVLAGFNLLPALPLDGGRIFRSLLALKFSFVRATQIAAGVSKILAIFLGLFGLLVQNFWMILLAFFI